MSLQRVFIGLPLASGDARTLHASLPPLTGHGMKAVSWQNYHITLAFIGPLSRETLATVESGLPGAAAFLPLSIHINSLAPFPKKSSGLLAALIEPGERLTLLHEQVKSLLATAGIEGEHRQRFRPHVTLARTRRKSRRPVFPRETVDLNFTLHRVGLYEGANTVEGYRYEPLFSIDRSAGSSWG